MVKANSVPQPETTPPEPKRHWVDARVVFLEESTGRWRFETVVADGRAPMTIQLDADVLWNDPEPARQWIWTVRVHGKGGRPPFTRAGRTRNMATAALRGARHFYEIARIIDVVSRHFDAPKVPEAEPDLDKRVLSSRERLRQPEPKEPDTTSVSGNGEASD